MRHIHRRPVIEILVCMGSVVLFATCGGGARADDWPQWLGPNRDGVWRETGLLQHFPPAGLRVIWRTAIGAGYAGPAVAGGRVYLMDRVRPVDARGKPLRPTRDGVPGTERLLCLSASDGKELWKYEYNCPYSISYPSGPRTTPVVRDGLVYALGAMGNLFCLDAASGKARWTKNLIKDFGLDGPPIWGFAAHLLLDGDRLISLVGGKGSAVVAFDCHTGKELWRALTTEEVGYSPPMIYRSGGKRQLIIWLSESINGVDPVTGKVYWTVRYPLDRPPQRPAVNITTVRKSGDFLFLSTYYHGPMMLELARDRPDAKVLWRGKSNNPERPDRLHILMAAPFLRDGYVYGVNADGELRCLRADTGQLIWKTYAATTGKKTDCASVFLIPQGDRFVLCNDQGDIILASLTPKGYHELGRSRILAPTQYARGRTVVWSHPAFAGRRIFARNDRELVCVSMASNDQPGTISKKGTIR